MLARFAAVMVMGALMLGGCKAQDEKILRLDYLPSKAAAKLTGPAVGVALPSESHGLAVNKLGEPIVGDVVKEDGSVSAHVLCVDSVPKWVGNAVAGELKAAGVNAGVGLDAKAGRTIVKTEITQLKNETKSQWSSNAVTSTISLEFKVEKDGKSLGVVQATGTGKVEASKGLPDVMHEAMQKALHDVLKQAMPKLVDAVRQGESGK